MWHLEFPETKAEVVVVGLLKAPHGTKFCNISDLSAPLQRDKRQSSCDTPLYGDTFQKAT